MTAPADRLVTNLEFELPADAVIVSRTDLTGRITECNAFFVQASGYDHTELVGAPHNILRHPDMPAPAFADLWATIRAGRTWVGKVKNRRKNGDHYWVRATASPVRRGDEIVGYISVRTPLPAAERQATDHLYKAINAGRLTRVEVYRGAVRPTRNPVVAALQRAATTMRARILGIVGLSLLAQLVLVTVGATAPDPAQALMIMAPSALVATVLLIMLAYFLHRAIKDPVDDLNAQFIAIANGDIRQQIEPRREDEFGDLVDNFRAMRARLIYDQFELAEQQRRAAADQQARDRDAQAAADERRREAEEARLAEERRQRVAEEARLTAEADRLAEAARLRQEADQSRRRDLTELADHFEQAVGEVVTNLVSAVADLNGSAKEMTDLAQRTANDSAAAASATQSSAADLQTAATATEQLSMSIREISSQVAHASSITHEAVRRADETNGIVQGLAGAARQIDQIVALITSIAGQTNLLALNATIEAARAGEAGKGFAVVAAEVKTLANQTAQATDEIAQQIAGVQHETTRAVQALGAIADVIHRIDAISTAIASAVEEQGAATGDIARTVESVARGTHTASVGVDNVSQAATNSGVVSRHLGKSAGDLEVMTARLRDETDQFLKLVRQDLKSV